MPITDDSFWNFELGVVTYTKKAKYHILKENGSSYCGFNRLSMGVLGDADKPYGIKRTNPHMCNVCLKAYSSQPQEGK